MLILGLLSIFPCIILLWPLFGGPAVARRLYSFAIEDAETVHRERLQCAKSDNLDMYVCSTENKRAYINAFRFSSDISKIFPIRTHKLYSRTLDGIDGSKVTFNDPLFSRQWYLVNKKQKGHDLNVLPIWAQGYFGNGVVIGLIDDGVDFAHEDLKDSFLKELSYDYNKDTKLPIPKVSRRDHHGTRCAGQIVAKPNNGVCGVGIAPQSKIAAIKILSESITSDHESAAIGHKKDKIHMYSCSWGPTDDGKSIDAPDALVLKAFIDGLIHGRGGLGSIYIFAAGNGGRYNDNCNYDGYSNGIFALTVGAIGIDDKMPPYMEPCSAQLVTAYSSNDQYKIATTELGGNQCTSKHGGTSAAAPMVVGVLALILSARRDLNWRDVRHILVNTAVPISTKDSTWVTNGAGYKYSCKFGFGKVDAARTFEFAKTWKTLGRATVRSMPTRTVNGKISGKELLVDKLTIDDRVIEATDLGSLTFLEYVTVKINMEHTFRGHVKIALKSPSGTTIVLATRRYRDDSTEGLRNWSMNTPGFWGEGIKGCWTLIISNDNSKDSEGILLDYRLSFWGSLAEDSAEPEEAYPTMFLHDFYPPSKDFFKEKSFIWDAKAVVPRKKYESILGFVRRPIVLCSLILLASMLMLVVFYGIYLYILSKRKRSLRSFLPVKPGQASHTDSSDDISMHDLSESNLKSPYQSIFQ